MHLKALFCKLPDGHTAGVSLGDHMLSSVSGFANAPGYNVEGTRYIIGPAPSGAFAAKPANALAHYQGGAWRFRMPENGEETWDAAAGALLQYNSAYNVWQPRLNVGAPTLRTAWLAATATVAGQSAWALSGQFYAKTLDLPGLSDQHYVLAEVSAETDKFLRAKLYAASSPNAVVFKTAEKPVGDLFVSMLFTRTRDGL